MLNAMISFVITTFIGFVVIFLVNRSHRKFNHPKREGNRQKPGTFPKFLLRFLIILDIFLFLLSALGIWMREKEMAIVCSIVAFAFLVAIIVVKKAYRTTYLETWQYIEVQNGKKTQKVLYENIVNWFPSYNEIIVIDKTKPERETVRVNLKIFKPEKLLRKLAEMAYEGRFISPYNQNPGDVYRFVEMIEFIRKHGYSYLVEDYIREMER